MDYKKLFDQYLLWVHRFIPKSLAPSVMGIDIGVSSIKVILLRALSNGKREVVYCALEPLGADGGLAALKKIAARFALNSHRIVSSVYGKGTLLRFVEWPRMPLEDLRKAYLFDLDKYFPFDPKGLYTDCAILDPQSKDTRMCVALVAVKRELVEQRCQLFQEAGLRCDSITLNAAAYARAFHYCPPQIMPSQNAKALVEIGFLTSCLMIFKEGILRLTRDISIGTQSLSSVGAEALSSDTSMQSLMAQMRLAMDYYLAEKNSPVDELFVTGTGALLEGVKDSLEKSFDLPVQVWNPLTSECFHIGKNCSDIAMQGSEWVVPLGLGI